MTFWILQFDTPQIAQNLLELLALLLPVAVALMGILIRLAREDQEVSLMWRFGRGLSFIAISVGILSLVSAAWIMLGWFQSQDLPGIISSSLALVVLGLIAIAAPTALYGFVTAFREFRDVYRYGVRNNDTSPNQGDDDGE